MSIATLAHVELNCDRFAESLEHFTDVVGLEESHRDGNSAYLRAYGD